MNQKDNIVGLAGYITAQPVKHIPVYGREGLYEAEIAVARDSGRKDTAVILFQGTEDDTRQQHQAGTYVMVCGQLQVYKEPETGRRLLFVLADVFQEIEKQVPEQNGVQIRGELAKPPVFRTTPLGKKITEICVKVPSAFREGYVCRIPAICWEGNALEAAEYQQGDVVTLEGRIQSREYTKKAYSDGVECGSITVTTYEVSAAKIWKEA